jgi:hypothetical protein
VITVRVVPRAGHTRVAGVRDGALVVRLAAAPVDGAANEALVALVAGALGVPKSRVALAGGARSRDKRVRVDGLSPEDARRRLSAILSGD